MLNPTNSTFKVALVQLAPVFLDREATLDLACEIIIDAGRQGANLIVFPEAFLPGYPEWLWSLLPNEESLHNRLYSRLLANAVAIPSPATDKLCRAAQRARINLVMGLAESETEGSRASCYNTLIYIDAQGQILGKHRQLILNGVERLGWSEGDGSTLGVYKFPFGWVGGLISGENFMPLARYALYAWGVQFYIATSGRPDEKWLISLQHIAREGGVYLIGCGRASRRSDLPADLDLQPEGSKGEWLGRGGSVIVSPNGEVLAGPFWEQQALIYAEIRPDEIITARRNLNITGQNGRPDIFELWVDRTPRFSVRTREAAPLRLERKLELAGREGI